MKANYTIACGHPETGKNGSWIFSGDNHRKPGTSLSPFFSSVQYLYEWMRDNGWTMTPGTAMGCHTVKK